MGIYAQTFPVVLIYTCLATSPHEFVARRRSLFPLGCAVRNGLKLFMR